MTPRSVTATVLLLFLIAAAPAAQSQPLADRLPADTIVYVGWGGTESVDGYSQSHLKSILDASSIPAVFTEFLPKLIAAGAAAEHDADVARMAEMIQSNWALMRRPGAIAFTGVDWQHEVPRLVFLVDGGDDADSVQKTLQRQNEMTEATARQGIPLKVTRFGKLLAWTIGYEKPETQLGLTDAGAAARNLAGSAGFRSAFAQMNKASAVAGYVDVQAVVRLAERAAAEGGDAEMAREWPKVRDALGLPGLRSVAVSMGFDQKDWATEVFVDAPAPRKGLLAAFDGGPLDDATFKLVPQDAIAAGAFQFDLSRLLDHVRSIAGEIEPAAPQHIDEAVGQLNAMLDMDVERDLFGSFGGQWAYYTSPGVGGQGILGAVLVNPLKDPAKAERSLNKLADLANQLIEQNVNDPHVKVRVRQTDVGGLTVHYVGLPVVTPTWAIKDGNLYVALYPQVVASAAGRGAEKSILDNPKFAAVRQRIRGAGGSVSAFQFADLQATAPQSYGSWLAVSRLVGFGDLIGVESPPMVLPELSVLMSHLGPAGSASWGDDAGLHFRAVSPFPGSSLLSQDPMAQMWSGQAAVATSVILPALNRAREQATRVKSMNNLKQIGLACHIIADDSRGAFPNDLGEIVLKQQELMPELFVNPRRGSPPPPTFPNREAMATWVRQNDDYVYVGKGMDLRRIPPSETVLAYENPAGLQDGINILFADGHVEFERMPEAMRRIEKAGKDRDESRPQGSLPGRLHPEAPPTGERPREF